jgi:3D-(3,5/4)-trihydroxycyclohexane-1,2-dione acylhydrolase (decyclizing)
MGYEIAGGLGVKLADPEREVFVLIGDASYLMMAQELVTAVQEGVKLIVVLVQNHGYASIGELSELCGSQGFGCRTRYRDEHGHHEGGILPIDLAANAASLGAVVHRAETIDQVHDALKTARDDERTTVVYVETDPSVRLPSTGSWWNVPVAGVSDMDTVRAARESYESHLPHVRPHL